MRVKGLFCSKIKNFRTTVVKQQKNVRWKVRGPFHPRKMVNGYSEAILHLENRITSAEERYNAMIPLITGEREDAAGKPGGRNGPRKGGKTFLESVGKWSFWPLTTCIHENGRAQNEHDHPVSSHFENLPLSPVKVVGIILEPTTFDRESAAARIVVVPILGTTTLVGESTLRQHP